MRKENITAKMRGILPQQRDTRPQLAGWRTKEKKSDALPSKGTRQDKAIRKGRNERSRGIMPHEGKMPQAVDQIY